MKKNKILYTNGCSLTYGTESVPQQDQWMNYSWPSYLGKLLNYDVVNDAVMNCSNDSIVRRTKLYLTKHNPDLVIIGWTSANRYEVFSRNPVKMIDGYYEYDDDGDNWIQCTVHSLENNHYGHLSGVAKFVKHILSNKPQENYDNAVNNLSNYLENKNVKYVFFNGYDTTNNKDKMFLPDTDATYYKYMVKNNIRPTRTNHFTKEANQLWAQKLFEHLT